MTIEARHADGTILRFPDDTPDSVIDKAMKNYARDTADKKQDQDLTLGQAALQGVKNIPSSAVKFGESAVQPIVHPIETYESVKNLGAGVLQKLGIMSGHESEMYAEAVGKFLKDRYGGYEEVKKTLANDPVGLAADIATVLTSGGTLAARAPGIVGKIGEVASAAGRAVDPLTAVKAAGTGASALTKGAVGGYLTHVGSRPLGEAFSAGRTGNEAAVQFLRHLRDPSKATEAVETARTAVNAIAEERGRAYRSGMIDISKDYNMLDFADVNAAIRKSEEVAQYKGVNLEKLAEANEVTAVRERMKQVVEKWREYAPAQYHTPEGFDAMKKALGLIWKGTEPRTQARLVAGEIYNAVKNTIQKQAPAYAKIMKGYEEASDLIAELERELVGKPETTLGPGLKKLQSIMRNNVHTNYGNREALAQLLVDNGAEHLMTQLAGQALNSWLPRGFGRIVGGADLAISVGEVLAGNPAVLWHTLAPLPFMSPRLMGETAYYAGKVSGTAGPYARPVTRGSFQAGRLPEMEGIPSYQAGGRPEPGQPAIVGEGGPELFVPDQPGTIVPAPMASAVQVPTSPAEKIDLQPQDPSVDTFAARFGAWNPLEKLLEQIKEKDIGTRTMHPGETIVDPFGYRGQTDPATGYSLLRRI